MTTAYGERINIQWKHHVYRKKTNRKKHQEWIQTNDSYKGNVQIRTVCITYVLQNCDPIQSVDESNPCATLIVLALRTFAFVICCSNNRDIITDTIKIMTLLHPT